MGQLELVLVRVVLQEQSPGPQWAVETKQRRLGRSEVQWLEL